MCFFIINSTAGGEMANEENLIPFSERTESEQREIQSKGGKKSGESRRKKKSMKQVMDMLLQMPANTVADYQFLADMGIDLNDFSETEINNMFVVNAALLVQAKLGNVKAIKELRSIIDDGANEKAKLKLEREKFEYMKKMQGGGDSEALAKLDEVLKEVRNNAVLSETE